jgi:hypothetical protein
MIVAYLRFKVTKYNTDQTVMNESITPGAMNPPENASPRLDTTRKTMKAFSIKP